MATTTRLPPPTCMMPRARRLARFIALLVAAMLAQVAAAASHASLTAAVPPDGAVLDAAPLHYSLIFSEPVSPVSLRLMRPDGASIQLDRYTIDGGAIEIGAPDGTARGAYVLSWRVVSADGHPIGGSIVFSVGSAAAKAPPPAETVDWVMRSSLWLSKVALYAGLFFGVGGVFSCRTLTRGTDTGKRLSAVALIVGALGALLSLGFQGADTLGVTIGRIGEPEVWLTGLGTSYGRTVVAALAAFALAGSALSTCGPTALAAAVAALLLAGLAPALSGHAVTAAPQWLTRPAVFLHALAIAFWIGALAPLGLAMRANDAAAAPALHRFSRTIPPVIAVLVLAGVALAIVQVERPEALFTTPYGQVLLVKLALLTVLFLLALANRRLLTAPAETGDPAAARRLARSIAAESLLVLLVFGAVAAWRFTPPPRALQAVTGPPAIAHVHTAGITAELTVTPGRAGPVDVSVLVMGRAGPLDAREVTIAFSNPGAAIEPIRRKAVRLADGAWQVEGMVMPAGGEWTVRLDVLISDFELASMEGRMTIAP